MIYRIKLVVAIMLAGLFAYYAGKYTEQHSSTWTSIALLLTILAFNILLTWVVGSNLIKEDKE